MYTVILYVHMYQIKKFIYTVCNDTRVNKDNVILDHYVCKHCLSLFVLTLFDGKTRLNISCSK